MYKMDLFKRKISLWISVAYNSCINRSIKSFTLQYMAAILHIQPYYYTVGLCKRMGWEN